MRRNLTTAIRIFSDCFEVERKKAGKIVRGRFIENSEGVETFPVKGSIQPLAARDIDMLPEGTRSDETLKLYIGQRLRTSKVGKGNSGVEPDHILYNDLRYEVQDVDDWSRQGNYYKYLLIKAGQ